MIEAMKQALEALESFREISDFTPAQAVHALTALREALAEAEKQEPVLFIHPDTFAMNNAHVGAWKPGHELPDYIPLYTTPPAAQRPWVGLTEQERDTLIAGGYDRDTIIMVEGLLKGSNT